MSLVPHHLTTFEAASILKCGHSTICRYVRQNKLPHKKLGNNILIPEQAVRKFERPAPGNPQFKKDR